MKLWTSLKEHALEVVIGALAAGSLGLIYTGGLALADARYVLHEVYTADNITRGVLSVEMQVNQVEYRIRDARISSGTAVTELDKAKATADVAFFENERARLLRQRADILKQD